MSSYLITGTSRGIGLELVKQLSALPTNQVSKIFAVTRKNNSKELDDLVAQSNGRIVNIITEITDASKLQKAAKEVEASLGGKGLDVVINNAGAGPWIEGGIKAWAADQMIDNYTTNVLSAHLTTVAFFPLLERGKGKKVVNITSTLGSISMAENFAMSPNHPYKMSKSALNMMTVQYAMEHKDQGFTFMLISPGYLRTEFAGGEYGDLEVGTGVGSVVDIIQRADTSANGKFFNIHVPGWENKEPLHRYDGAEVAW